MVSKYGRHSIHESPDQTPRPSVGMPIMNSVGNDSKVSETVQDINVSHIDVEMVQSKLKIKKKSADEINQHTFNYRISEYDIAFAVSITDELI